MPASTAKPERSFTAMRTIRTYMGSGMLTERLLSIALMHAYREMPIDHKLESYQNGVLCEDAKKTFE